MKSKWFKLMFGIALGMAGTGWAALTPEQSHALPPAAAHKIDFKSEIAPIFEASCIQCHGRGRDKGGLRIDSRQSLLQGGDTGPAAVPGQATNSILLAMVSGVLPDDVMPKKGKKLTPEQCGVMRAWIDQGMPWDPLVTFGPVAPKNLTPRLPDLPAGQPEDNPVDRFMEVYFQAHGIHPAEPVPDRVFARRAYLDTIGLLPPPGELEAFVVKPDPDKRRQLVADLLSRRDAYAQNWLSFWNDLLRNDYKGTGYIDGGRKQITRWLYSALVTNMPYDQFVSQLIKPAKESAGFIRGIVWRGAVNASEKPQMQAAQNISQVFMGVNLKCASCHDSFVNDWRLSDSYGLANVFSDDPLEINECDKPTGKMAVTKFLFPQLGELTPSTNREERLQKLAGLVTCPKDGRFTRTIVNRLWAKFMGRGLVESVDDMQQTAWNQDLLDWLAEDLAAHHYDLKATMARILTSRAYQLPPVDPGETNRDSYVFTGPRVRRMSAEEFQDALASLTRHGYAKADADVNLKEIVQRESDLTATPPAGHSDPAEQSAVRASLVASDALQTALGRPNRDQVVTTRSTTATTLQALELTNGKTLAEELKRGAADLVGEGLDGPILITNIYEQAVGRKPTAAELRLASALVGTKPQAADVEDFLWAVVMLPEFQLIY